MNDPVPREYDKRLPREEAEALVRRRIDRSDLRYAKERFGLALSDKLSDHFELVHVRREEAALRLPEHTYYVHVWGVKVNGQRAGYISTSFYGDRHQLLPYSYPGTEIAGD